MIWRKGLKWSGRGLLPQHLPEEMQEIRFPGQDPNMASRSSVGPECYHYANLLDPLG
jgi:hypothetical protein